MIKKDFCIKEQYRNLGIVSIILKQAINDIFNNYNCKSIYAQVIEDNYASQRLMLKTGFKEFAGYRRNDYFKTNGVMKKQKHYLYTINDYNNDSKKMLKYGQIKLKY